MHRPNRPALLFPVLATAFVALACRSLAPIPPAPEAEAPTRAVAPQPGPLAPSVPPGGAAEDERLALVRAVLAVRAKRIAEPQREQLAVAEHACTRAPVLLQRIIPQARVGHWNRRREIPLRDEAKAQNRRVAPLRTLR